MRPYIPNKRVGDYKNELPHYYCNKHNPNPEVYPTEPGKKVTIVEEPIVDPEPDDPENPGTAPGIDPGNDPVIPPETDNPGDEEEEEIE